MRVKLGSQLLFYGLLVLLVHVHEARADFASCTNPLSACTATSSGCCKLSVASANGYNAALITTDRCHQPFGTGTIGPPGTGAPRKEFTITSISRSTTTVTVTTSVAHGLGSNEYVKISGTGVGDFTGTFQIKTANGCSPACTTSQFQFTTTSSGAASAATGKVLSHNFGQGWCADSPGTDSTRIGGAAADNGLLRAYGLVYRLMQRGVPVYWLVNPSKSVLALNAGENASAQSYLASDVDLWVLTGDLTDPPSSSVSLTACGAGCTQPVHRLKSADLTKYTDSYRYKQFPVRGGAFLIAPENRQAFEDFWKHQGTYSTLTGTKYDWASAGIDVYDIDASAKIVYQDFTTGDGTTTSPWTTNVGAPLAIKVDYEPPRVACLGCDSNVAQAWLDAAGLRDPATAASCASGEFVPSDATYCLLNDYDVAQGTLVSGGFSWLWMFGYNDNSPCADSSEKAVFDKVRDFMTSLPGVRNAGHGVFLDDSIKVAEGCGGKQLMGLQQATDGLALQSSGAAEPFIMRYPANLFMQIADFPPSIASGTVKGWKYYQSGSTVGYQAAFNLSTSSLRRLMTVDTSGTNNTFCIQHSSSVLCDSFTPTASTGDLMDVASYARLKDNLNNGLMYYLPGNQLNNSGNVSELRMLLNSLLALPDESFTTTPNEIEVARSSPIVATVDALPQVFQGTYVRQDPVPSIPKATTSSGLSRFTFPYITGHFRAIDVANFAACSGATCGTSNANRQTLASMAAIFDAANRIPTANAAGCATNFNGSCRTVFTTLASGRTPAHVFFTTGNATTLGPVIGSNLTTAEQQTLISRILAGKKDVNGNWVSKLGGVNRSTAAVIEPSPLAGSAGRPTMAYFGATDGMLHAVCVTTGGGCDQIGRELWAYIPRTVLPDLRQSTALVDGSPHVIDAYGDFDNNGTNAWTTILIFSTGTGRMTANNVVPAVYAIDITAPNNPKVLWEYSVTNVGARGSYEMGVALNLMAATVSISNVNKTVAFVQSNNGGTGGAASVLTAIDVETGSKIWQVGDLYPTSSGKSARNTAHEAAPSSGIPGGAVAIDTIGNGKVNKVVYGDLYGDVFVRDAATGTNQNGAGPLLRISADYKPIGVPPAIYKRGSTQYAAFVTGGYADSQASLWRGDNETPVPTQMLFAVSTAYTGGTTNENDATNVPTKFNLGAGEGGFAQVTVVGNELFATTDNTNINDFSFGTSSAPTGHVYRFDFGATVPAQESTLVVASGAGSIANNGTTLINAGGQYGEQLTAGAQSTTGLSVDPTYSTNKLSRALWLRTE